MGRVNYRILYFFHGRDTAVLVHALTKEDQLPIQEIRRATEWKRMFETNPEGHMACEESSDGQDT
jgi:hypothetical protein